MPRLDLTSCSGNESLLIKTLPPHPRRDRDPTSRISSAATSPDPASVRGAPPPPPPRSRLRRRRRRCTGGRCCRSTSTTGSWRPLCGGTARASSPPPTTTTFASARPSTTSRCTSPPPSTGPTSRTVRSSSSGRPPLASDWVGYWELPCSCARFPIRIGADNVRAPRFMIWPARIGIPFGEFGASPTSRDRSRARIPRTVVSFSPSFADLETRECRSLASHLSFRLLVT